MIRFIAIVLTAFLARVNAVYTIANPSCMNITREPAISHQARLSELSSAGDDAAVCARAADENKIIAPKTVAPNASCDRLGIISPVLDMTGGPRSAPPGNGWRAKSEKRKPRSAR